MHHITVGHVCDFACVNINLGVHNEHYFLDLNKQLAKYAPDGWLEKVK